MNSVFPDMLASLAFLAASSVMSMVSLSEAYAKGFRSQASMPDETR